MEPIWIRIWTCHIRVWDSLLALIPSKFSQFPTPSSSLKVKHQNQSPELLFLSELHTENTKTPLFTRSLGVGTMESGVPESLDRISSLPKEVMDEILMRLPIRDAIKTSLLSTNWMYKWTSIPRLVFKENTRRGSRISDWVKFVDCALLLHNGVISEFKLKHFLLICCSNVSRWIVVLSRKGLQNLTLSFFGMGGEYKAPASLFNCSTLKTLRLDWCVLSLPSPFNGLSHLTDLKLVNVTLTNESFETLVVKLPLLGSLKLDSCRGLDHINVRAPNLKAAYIDGIYLTINFHDSPNLVNLYLCPRGMRMPLQPFEDIISGLLELQVVDLTYPRIKNFALDAAWVELHVIYHHLTYAIFQVNTRDPIQILSVILLCRSSPCLEKLKIVDIGYSSFDVTFKEPLWDAWIRKEDVFHLLKSVRWEDFHGMELELGLVQFILMNALVLETLHISWRYEVLDEGDKYYVLVKISEFERASSKAKVFFCD